MGRIQRMAFLIGLLLLSFALVSTLTGCWKIKHKDESAPVTGDDDADDDVADDDTNPQFNYRADLEVELHDNAGLLISQADDGSLQGFMAFGTGNDLTPAGPLTIQGTGKLMDFPEAETKGFMIKFNGPAIASGPCGNDPVSLAMMLLRRANNGWAGGSLTARCGQDNFSGKALRVMKLAGKFTEYPEPGKAGD